MERYQKAKRISIYLSMPDTEIQTQDLVMNAFAADMKVFVPYIEKGNPDMRMFGLWHSRDFESLQRDRWGIPSLNNDSLSQRESGDGDLDIVFMPAMAFQADSLDRLGHGKGYYDRFISSYLTENEGQRPFLVGLALEEQMIASPNHIPTTSQDYRPDLVVTGSGQVLTRSSNG
ncbi:MAG: hypothetical protein Q9159_001307 [Coniocarpon cinnabarinum]